MSEHNGTPLYDLDPVWLDQYQIWILKNGSWNHKAAC